MANKRFGNYLVGEINPDEMNRIPFHHVNESKRPAYDFVMVLSTESNDGEFRIEYDDLVPTDELKDMLNSVDRFMKAAMKNVMRPRRNDVVTTYPVSGEMYLDRPIFQHYYLYPHVGHFGGLTIATMYNKHTNSYVFGFAVCHENDNYVKKLGNEYSWLDLNENQFTIPVEDFAKYVVRNPVGLSRGSYSVTVKDPVQFVRSCTPRVLASAIGLYIDGCKESVNLPSKVIPLLTEYKFYPRKELNKRY